MGYFGVKKPLQWGKFSGMCTEVDPTELPSHLASDAQNIDFDGEAASVRLGWGYYNTDDLTGDTVQGIGVYYPPDGSARSVVMAGNGKVYVDKNQDGDFSDSGEQLKTGLANSGPIDIFQRKGQLFAANLTDGMFWTNSMGTALAASTLPATPTLALAPKAAQTLFHDFEVDASGVTGGGTVLTAVKVNTGSSPAGPAPVSGTHCLRLKATTSAAEKEYAYQTLGATYDLSPYAFLELRVWCSVPNPTFRVAIFKTGDTPSSTTPDWGLFPTFKISADGTKQWVRIVVPLSVLTTAELAACPGFAIQFLGAGGRGYNKPITIFFDYAVPGLALDPGDYTYYYTTDYRVGTAEGPGESAPHLLSGNTDPGETVPLEAETAVSYISGSIPASLNGSTQTVRLYRKHENGPFRLPRLIQTFTGYSGSAVPWTDKLTDGALAIQAAQGAAPELDLQRTSAPKASTWAVVNNRILAGNVTVGSTNYPYRVWVSYYGDAFAWSASETPDDPSSAGWFDIPEKDPIVRIVDYQGVAIIFTTRSVWTLTGSGFADFNVTKRGAFGLLNREAVVVAAGIIYFLSGDGVRVMYPHSAVPGEYECRLISEPIAGRIAAMSNSEISTAALGQDERGRILVSVASNAYVFDPRIPGAMQGGTQLLRPGWSYHTGIGCAIYTQMRRGGSASGWTDAGQLLGGGANVFLHLLKVKSIFRTRNNAALRDDASTAITWYWTSPAVLAEAMFRVVAQWVTGVFTAAANQTVTAEVLDQTGTATGSATLSLGSGSSGFAEPTAQRYGPSAHGKTLRLKLSGTHSVAMSIRQAILGVFQR